MSETINDVYVDIPFITEEVNTNERRLSKGDGSVVVPWYRTDSRTHSDSPSPCSSFRDDGALLTRKHTVPFVFVSGQPYRTSSLGDINGIGRAEGCVYPAISRHIYGRRSQYSEFGVSRSGSSRSRRKESTSSDYRRSSVRSSVRSNRSRKSSYNLDRSKSVRSNYSRRISIPPPIQKTEEDLKREKRHRIAVWFLIGSFIFIAASSILVVIITLTHQSEYNYANNGSMYYYTFAKPSNLP